jgi:hypothetical protein
MLVGGFRRALGGMVNKQRLAAGFADSEKDIKMRLKSVSSTRKITKAMKMVATAKMKSEVDRLENGKHFGVHFLPQMFQNDEYMMRKVGDFEAKRTLLVPVTTDRLAQFTVEVCAVVSTLLLSETQETSSTDRMTSLDMAFWLLEKRELLVLLETSVNFSLAQSMKLPSQSTST